MGLVDILGPTLRTKSGDKKTEDLLKGVEAVGLYYTGDHCPPCRSFKPLFLAELARVNAKKKRWLVVYFYTQPDMKAYFDALPDGCATLQTGQHRYIVGTNMYSRGIPALIMLDLNGEVTTRDARTAIENSVPFPYCPEEKPAAPEPKPRVSESGSAGASPLTAFFGPELITHGGTRPTAQVLGEAEVVAMFFSMKQCGWCDIAKPIYEAELKKVNTTRQRLVVAFVPSSAIESTEMELFADMPADFVMVPIKAALDIRRKGYYTNAFPTIMLVNTKGEVVNKSAHSLIKGGTEFPYDPKIAEALRLKKARKMMAEEDAAGGCCTVM